MHELSELYDKDYNAWTKRMAELLKNGHFAELDTEHLIEELEEMGKSEQREWASRLRVLLSHLLKWQYQYRYLSERWREFDGKSWRNTLSAQRAEIRILLKKYPGIKRYIVEITAEAYQDARELAAEETGLPIETFPLACPYTEEQIRDQGFYPPQQ